MKKSFIRTIACLMAVVMLLSVAPLSGISALDLFGTEASAAYADALEYEVKDGKATVTRCDLSVDGALVIPSELGGYPVTSIGDHAFRDCKNLSSVTIPDSVTSIGSDAFGYCYSLTNITIPNSVTSIGNYTFCDCENLTSLIIPDSVTKIGDYAFISCDRLTNVTIGNGVTNISDGAFFACERLTSVIIPNSVTSISSNAFLQCRSLTNVTIPNSVTSIGDFSFCHCHSLTSITIPNSVTSIGDYAFDCCIGLTSVTIGNDVTSIGYNAFRRCENLSNITLGNSVEYIDEGAFLGCSSLKEITVPSSVKSISSEHAIGYDLGEKEDDYIKMNDFKIKGYTRSAAERYAKDNGFEFISIGSHEHNYALTITTQPTCTEQGIKTFTCSCGDSYIEAIPATGHVDTDKDGYCDTCSTELEHHIDNCDCMCHKTGLVGFIYKIILVFWKLFRINKTCACGGVHY